MFWIILTIVAYILFAFSALADRYLLAGPIKSPLVYTFYISITSVFALVLIPFGFFVPSPSFIGLSLATGVVSVLALYSLYHAISRGSVSRIIPMVGALMPIITLILTLVIAGAYVPSVLGGVALALLIAATVLLSLNVIRGRLTPSLTDIIHVVITAFLFALFFVLLKVVYDNMTFINGFIWTRFFAFLFVLSFLLIPTVRQAIFAKKNPLKKKGVFLPALLGKGSGVVGGILQQYAISIAAVSQLPFINALQGVQYISLLALVVLVAKYRPSFLKEQLGGTGILVRSVGIATLIAGLYLLFRAI